MRTRSFPISSVVLLALTVCLHLFSLREDFYSVSWDESGRTLDAYEWAAQPSGSQHPDAFIRNSVPKRPGVPGLPHDGSIRNALASQGIRFLVFRGDDYKSLLNQSPEVARLGDFGPWSIYKMAP